MKLDSELELWRTEWQSSSEVPALDRLRARVARQSMYLRILLLADILVTVVIGGGTILLAVRSPRAATVLLAAATWLFITAAWIFGLSNRRGTWSPRASTTSAFLDLSIRRCRGDLRSITFGVVLYICLMTFCLSWVFHELSFSLSSSLTSTTMKLVCLLTLLLAAISIWYRKKKRSDLAYLLNLQRELEQAE